MIYGPAALFPFLTPTPVLGLPLVRLGTPGEGGYVVPDWPALYTAGLLSYGVGGNPDFENDFFRRYGGTAVAFDPTVRRPDHMDGGIRFVPHGLGPADDGVYGRIDTHRGYLPPGGFLLMDGSIVGASPDGFVDDDGTIQAKNPRPKAHMDFLLSRTVPSGYRVQVQWEMMVSGRKWCDFFSYCPSFPEKHRLVIVRVLFDEQWVNETLRPRIDVFVKYVNELKEQLAA
jgi:hypothetical protein